jgi:hypothetical protein
MIVGIVTRKVISVQKASAGMQQSIHPDMYMLLAEKLGRENAWRKKDRDLVRLVN